MVTFEERSGRKMGPLAPGRLWAATSLFESDQWSLFKREVEVKWLQLSRGGRGGRLLLLELYASLGFEPSSITSNSEIPPLQHAEPYIFKCNFRGATLYKMFVFKKENSLGQGGGKVCDFILA